MDIYEKIKNGHYETKLPYPKKPSKACFNCGHNCATMNGNITVFCSNCGTPVKNKYDLKLKSYQCELSEHKDDARRLNNMLKTDALTHCGIGNHKKTDVAFQVALNERDNSQNIIEFLEELAELMVY